MLYILHILYPYIVEFTTSEILQKSGLNNNLLRRENIWAT